jgi:hypothetical protein
MAQIAENELARAARRSDGLRGCANGCAREGVDPNGSTIELKNHGGIGSAPGPELAGPVGVRGQPVCVGVTRRGIAPSEKNYVEEP